ncbi:MAG: ATP-binding protein [Candidatus Aminicenantaceae bacterium]
MKTLRVLSDMEEIDRIRSFLRENLGGLNISESDYYQIEVSLLEVCINIIQYAYPQDKGEIFLKSWQKGGRIYFEIRDSGVPFDPRKIEKPDINESIKNGKVGGFGILLSREFMDGFDYKRENNQNVVTIYRKLKEV